MSYWWIRCTSLGGVCVQAKTEAEAKAVLTEDEQSRIQSVQTLPYPAKPYRNQGDDTTPEFCYKPNQCAGRTACPQNYSCTE